MSARLVLVAAALLAAAPARAGLFGRSRLAGRWAAKPVAVNGDDSDWDDASAFEEDGLSVLARNDARNLYLLITAHARETRDLLSGESHQDLTLWFVGADGKTRRWGARLPFSRRAPLTNSLRDPAGVDPEPEQVSYQGAAISTGPLPDDVVDRLSSVGRRPIWEFKIPLKRLERDAEGAVAVDFVVNAPAGGVRRPARSAPAPEDTTGEQASGSSRRGRGRREDAGSHPEEALWNALSYALSVRLAPDPSLPR